MRRALCAVAGVLALLLGACSGTTPGNAGSAVPGGTHALPSPTAPVHLPDGVTQGLTQAEVDDARRLVAALPLEQVAGQVVVARFSGTTPATAAALVSELHLGGVILMGDNVESPQQVRAVADAVQQAHRTDGESWPAVVAVDQEGGQVARVTDPATEFPTLMTAGAARDAAVTRAAASASGTELRAMGFTWVFAPDADVTVGPSDTTIGSRSASDEPAVVSDVVRAAVRGYADAGIVSVAKHYPGHGSVTTDSHVDLPVQPAPLDALRARDLQPFRAAAEAGVPAVMVGHIAVDALDPGVPTSLSPKAYHLLHDETGFTGLAVTDALDMGAVTKRYGSSEAAVTALTAGADVLLMPPDPRAARDAVVAAVTSGDLPRARLDDAASRLVALIRHQAEQEPPAPLSTVGTHHEESYALSLAGLTVASGPCTGAIVHGSVRVAGGTALDRDRFIAAARTAGLEVGSGPLVRLLSGPVESADGDVVVALDAPYGLAASTASLARIALYGRTPDAFRALADVLTGVRTAGGHLPVEVTGLPSGAGCR